MKQSLQLKIGQTLAMTPQLQQAIRLLQLSTLELQSEIQDALESNPLLEVQEEESGASNSEKPVAEPVAEAVTAEAAEVEQEVRGSSNETPDNLPDELPVDSAWEDIYESAYPVTYNRDEENTRDFTEFHSGAGTSLQDHLMEQVYLRPLKPRDLQIAVAIIDAVDDDGYLSESVEDIMEGLNRVPASEEDWVDIDEVMAGLRLVQHLDPIACASRDLGECMLLQLEQLDEQPGLQNAIRLAKDHLQLLASHDYNRLRRELKISEAELRIAITLIRTLTPRPGAQISESKAQYIVPDVFVRRQQGAWRVELNPEIAPKLGVNNLYANMVKRADKSDDNNFIRNHLQEARWFIKSLQSRNETLLRVATAIVEHQKEFLEYGDEAMKPLVLRDIAEQLSMHESTISRVTTQKYMHTPKGILEFKYFFSSHVSTTDGGECSATAIRAMIRKLIAEESPQQPLSDSKIANTLVANGIKVARRTIAKYREAMSIPPSNERKRLS